MNMMTAAVYRPQRMRWGTVRNMSMTRMTALSESLMHGERNRLYEYDCRGNMIRMTGFGGGVTTIRYNSLNKPEAYIDEDGNCTEYSYDRMWNVISRKTQDGAVTSYEYDGRGRMVSITDPEGKYAEGCI